MKRILFILFVYISISQALAIKWEPVRFNNSVYCHIDEDSIKKTDNYYFYNITFKAKTGENLVITLQSALSSPFSARLKIYSLEDYINLDGDYEHIEDNKTENLETVTYGSVVNAAYNHVKTLEMLKNNKTTIIIGE